MMLSMVSDLARHSILGMCGFELKPLNNVEPAAAFRPRSKMRKRGCKADPSAHGVMIRLLICMGGAGDYRHDQFIAASSCERY